MCAWYACMCSKMVTDCCACAATWMQTIPLVKQASKCLAKMPVQQCGCRLCPSAYACCSSRQQDPARLRPARSLPPGLCLEPGAALCEGVTLGICLRHLHASGPRQSAPSGMRLVELYVRGHTWVVPWMQHKEALPPMYSLIVRPPSAVASGGPHLQQNGIYHTDRVHRRQPGEPVTAFLRVCTSPAPLSGVQLRHLMVTLQGCHCLCNPALLKLPGPGSQFGYRIGKCALNMAGATLALDLKPDGIPLALIHPGVVS